MLGVWWAEIAQRERSLITPAVVIIRLRQPDRLALGEAILDPRDRNHKQRTQESAEQHVNPREGHVICRHAECGPDGPECSVMFHA